MSIVRFVAALCITAILHAPGTAPLRAEPADADDLPPPRNIRMDPSFAPIFRNLLRKSETVRRQCRIIGSRPDVSVVLVAALPPRESAAPRAKASISRYRHGAVRAVIELPPVIDFNELIPHELEHVIEQLEGLDLPALGRARERGVVQLRDGTYETARARAAGLAAAREVYDRPDTGVVDAGRSIARGVRTVGRRATSQTNARSPVR